MLPESVVYGAAHSSAAMIDIHSHILPGLDDGAEDMAMAVRMAEMAVADGITYLVCTPHITPGVYHNDTAAIAARLGELQRELDKRAIALHLLQGADVHLAPGLRSRLDDGSVPTLAGSRAFLFEPPHHVLPPRLEQAAIGLVEAGYIPVLTHPERLSWIESRYDVVEGLVSRGVLIQLTAGSITGSFGARPKYWSERMLDEGKVDVIASDAHNLTSRRPVLSEARDRAAQRLGETEAENLVLWRPAALLNGDVLPPRAGTVTPQMKPKQDGMLASIKGWLHSRRG